MLIQSTDVLVLVAIVNVFSVVMAFVLASLLSYKSQVNLE